jgi:hypothetical protein
MVFGLCATRVIGFIIAFVKDVVASQKVERTSNSGVLSEDVDRSQLDAATEEKKTI